VEAETRDQAEMRIRESYAAEPRVLLDGLKVLDFTNTVLGPTTTRYLSDHGATVVKIETLTRLLHDQAVIASGAKLEDPAGFTVTSKETKIGLATDLGVVTGMVKQHLKNCDLLLLEANHDVTMLEKGPYPWPVKQRIKSREGHLSNDQAAELLENVSDERLQQLVLAHLSEANNHPDKAYEQASRILKGKLKRRRITQLEYNHILSQITATVDYSGFRNTDFVVEAIVEDLDIKKKVFKELEENISENAIVVSNTSSLLINDMATVFKNPTRFVGMHFFNPVHKMPLVEVVRGKHSSDDAIATTFVLAKKLGKTPVIVNDGPGFLVNRLLVPYMVEAVSLLEEGYSIPEIDKTMIHFGMPMGPIELFDEVGIDVAYKVANILSKSMGSRMAESDILENMVNNKKFGKKNNNGFYIYNDRKKRVDPEIGDYIKVKDRSKLKKDELIKRMVYPMINEAARCLEDDIVRRPQDVDLAMIFGTGFAPFRGGLLNYADTEGIDEIIRYLDMFAESTGERFKPCETLIKMQNSSKNFYSFFSQN